jgi:hypothetical protein
LGSIVLSQQLLSHSFYFASAVSDTANAMKLSIISI